jgi:chromosome segregation ATPase
LEPSYNFHCSLVNEITSLDGTVSEILTNAIDIYSQVNDEIAAIRVRFRNLLNIDERRALDNAYETLADYSKKFTPIDKAQGLLNEYSQFQKKQLENLYKSINENDNSLEEMRGQVSDLLNQLDAQHLKIAQLNQQILDLKKPLKWSFAQSRELQIGNLIIEYFWQSGIYLDRTHSQGDVYSVKLYFQIDRNSRAITPQRTERA